ncbi:hypothetical protein F7D09_2078 [Bifidobacterium leontopitheci]|uniref:DUF559 domain-containing protein n=2 Tax=Bifidobacterium leontopitheci TaxID=2650774 RepID=A0A6I1GBI3_9BIFI|nr:hypothetical protein F7D09_2078 [Bifidobacterium leontopitheci]
MRTIISRRPVYTGFTALRLNGIETPWCPKLHDAPFHLLYEHDNHRHLRDGSRYLHLPDALAGRAHLSHTFDGTTIVYTDPLTTWAILSRHLSQIETIVLADSILRRSSDAHRDAKSAFRRFLYGCGPFRGKGKCLDSIAFLDYRTDSPMECRSVLTLLKAGLPEPNVHWTIYIPALQHLATVDIAYPEAKVIIEFDGDMHRIDRQQHRWDERKRQALRDMGYIVIVIFSDDVLTEDGRRSLISRVAQALRVSPPGQPAAHHMALCNDERDAEARARQRKYRKKKAIEGIKV